MLLLLLSLAGALIFFIFTHELGEELVSLLSRVIKDKLALFDDRDSLGVAIPLADSQRGITLNVSLEDISLCILQDVFENINVRGVLSGQMQDIVSSASLFHRVIGIAGEQDLDGVRVLLW